MKKISFIFIALLLPLEINSKLPGKTEITEKDIKKSKIFSDYKKNADCYLNAGWFDGTPLSGELLARCARRTYEKTGILVPLELALAQAQWESGMGRYGRSAKTNPFNVGEYDTHTAIVFESTEKGVQAYYDLIARDYLKNKKLDDLLKRFVNKDGLRYASAKDYEAKIKNQVDFIKKWLNKNCLCN